MNINNWLAKNKWILISSVILTIIAIKSFKELIFAQGVPNYGEWFWKDSSVSATIDLFPDMYFSAWNPSSFGNSNLGLPGGLNYVFLSLNFSIGGLLLGDIYYKLFIIFASLYLPFYSYFFFTRYIIKNEVKDEYRDFAAAVSALILAVSPKMSGHIGAGHLTGLWAFAGLLPLVLLCHFRFKEKILFRKKKSSIKYIVAGGFILALIMQLSAHGVVMFFIFVVFDAVFSTILNKNIKHGLISILGLIGFFIISFILNLYFILPSLLYPELSIEVSKVFSLQQLIYNSKPATILTILTITSSWRGSPTLLGFFYILIPLFTLLFNRSKKVLYFSAFLVFGVFLTKGVNPPFTELSTYLYLNMPFMDVFRDPLKFIFFVMMACSVLIGIFVGIMTPYLKNFIDSSFNSLRSHKLSLNISQSIVLCSFIVLLVILNTSYLSGNFNNSMTMVKAPDSVKDLNLWLHNDTDDFRMVYYPAGRGLKMNMYEWYPPEAKKSPHTVAPIALYRLDKPTVAYSWSRTYAGRVMGYINNLIESKDMRHLSAILFTKANIKYVIIDNTFRKDTPFWTKSREYEEYFKKNEAYNKVKTGDFSVFEDSLYKDGPFYASSNFINVVGNINVYSKLYDISHSILNVPILFTSQTREGSIGLFDHPHTGLIFYNSNNEDYIANMINSSYRMVLNDYIDSSKENSWSNANVGILVLGMGLDVQSKSPVHTSRIASINVSFNTEFLDEYDLYLRVLYSDKSGKLNISLDGRKIKVINPRTTSYIGFHWVHLGSYYLGKNSHILTIQNEGDGEATLDGLIIIPSFVKENIEKALNLSDLENKIFIYDMDYISDALSDYISISLNGKNITGFSYSDDFKTNKWINDTYSYNLFKRGTNDNITYFLYTSQEGTGFYNITYKIKASDPINKMYMQWDTSWLTPSDRIGYLFISLDGSNWTQVNSDNPPKSEPYDISKYANGHKTVYLKYEIHDKNNVFGAWIRKIKFYGTFQTISFRPNIPKGTYSMFAKITTKTNNTTIGININNRTIYTQIKEKKENQYLFLTNLTFQKNQKITLILSDPIDIKNIIMTPKTNQLNLSKIFNFTNNQPKINYKKISSTKYNININSTEPFLLVFRESYSPYWKIGNKHPIIVDYYANSYYFKNVGNYNYDITYIPQRIYKIGFIVSILFFIIIVIGLMVDFAINKRL